MFNATQEKQKTAVELFQTGDKNVIDSLTEKLGLLLSDTTEYWFYNDTKYLTLQEFQDNFDWDENYQVQCDWEVDVSNFNEVKLDCSCKEEAMLYLNGDKEIEQPQLDDYLPDYDHTGEVETSLIINVNNLRLKPQEPKQKTWKLTFEVLADSSLEDTDLDSFCGQVALLATQQGGTIKVVGTDFSVGESLPTTWSDVVGQK